MKKTVITLLTATVLTACVPSQNIRDVQTRIVPIGDGLYKFSESISFIDPTEAKQDRLLNTASTHCSQKGKLGFIQSAEMDAKDNFNIVFACLEYNDVTGQSSPFFPKT